MWCSISVWLGRKCVSNTKSARIEYSYWLWPKDANLCIFCYTFIQYSDAWTIGVALICSTSFNISCSGFIFGTGIATTMTTDPFVYAWTMYQLTRPLLVQIMAYQLIGTKLFSDGLLLIGLIFELKYLFLEVPKWHIKSSAKLSHTMLVLINLKKKSTKKWPIYPGLNVLMNRSWNQFGRSCQLDFWFTVTRAAHFPSALFAVLLDYFLYCWLRLLILQAWPTWL